MVKLSEKELKKYTKDELVFYLKHVERYIPSFESDSPKHCILQKRHDDVTEEIDNVLYKTKKLREEQKENMSEFDYRYEHILLHKEWEKLFRKQRKIEKELFDM